MTRRPRLVALLLCTVTTPAAAGFAPDQPGLGSSTGVVPRHASMVEAGIALGGTLGASPVMALPGLQGRIGLKPDDIELRVGIPGLIVPFDGPLGATPLTAGMKWVGGDTVGVSIVPTVALPLPGNNDPLGVLSADVEANLSWDAPSSDWGVWGTGHGGGGRDGAWGGGGAGAWYNPDGVGLYAHSGYEGGLLVGGGGWWALAQGVQANLGVDVWPGVPATVVVNAGVSVQR